MLLITFELTLNVIYLKSTQYQWLIKCNTFCIRVLNIQFVKLTNKAKYNFLIIFWILRYVNSLENFEGESNNDSDYKSLMLVINGIILKLIIVLQLAYIIKNLSGLMK